MKNGLSERFGRHDPRLAGEHFEKRLESYAKPDIDPAIEKDLEKYVETKMNILKRCKMLIAVFFVIVDEI
jgi:trimethylamine:corrinoid methyltransferase-like protein